MTRQMEGMTGQAARERSHRRPSYACEDARLGEKVHGLRDLDLIGAWGRRPEAVNKRPTFLNGVQGSSVVTLRDTTEPAAVSGRAEVARERLKLVRGGDTDRNDAGRGA
jgi:hypothetical protein